jgi:FkbM family methyltransferase
MSTKTWLDRKIKAYSRVIETLGPFPALTVIGKGALDRRGLAHRAYQLRSRRAKFPLWCRPRSSDLFVFEQVFIDLEYSCVDGVVDPKLIIDCGANVGYASAYFLSKFPDARVIAIEPDPDNVKWLRRNLEPYGNRATVLDSAIWSHPVGLIVEANHGDGLEWARQVRESLPGETPHLIATDLATILDKSGADSISILKMDVEGSESVIFSSHYEGWLDRVENIAIELHGDKCASVFHEAIGDHSFRITRSGELTFCARNLQTSSVN